MDYTERTAQLTPADKRELRKVLIGVGIFTAFAIGIGLFANHMMGAHGSGDDIFNYFLIGFGVLFFGVIFYMAGSAALDLTSGMKTIYTGVVTDKETYRSRSKKGGNQPKYYLFFGNKKLYVTYKHFGEVNVSDEIELHYAKRSGTSLSVVHLNQNHEPGKTEGKLSAREVLNQRKEEREAVVKKEYPLTDEDIRVLRRKRNSKLFVNFFLLIFFTIMTLGFGIGALVDWVFMIPEVVFLTIIYFSFKWIVRCFSKLNKDKKEGVKVVAISHLKDKQISSHGSRKGYTITTDYGSFPVSQEVYEGLSKGDQVYSFHGKHSNWLIGIHTEKSGYIAE